jgi:outer membrane protein assembly factor BamB
LQVSTALVAAWVASGCGSSPASATAPTANPFSAAIAGTGDWPMLGHDPARSNCNLSETSITAANASHLAPAWQFNVGWNGNPTASAPVVSNGQVFVGSSVNSGDNYFALSTSTGSLLWSANLGHLGPLSATPCGGIGIGSTAAVAEGTLVVGGGDASYYALNPATGALLWNHPLNVGPDGFAWESPLIASGLVYVGVASACFDNVVKGELRSLDITTGALLQDHVFVPPGHVGAGIWNSPSLSPDGSTLFITTGEDHGTNDPESQAVLSMNPQTLATLQVDREGPINEDKDFVTPPIVFSDEAGRLLVAAPSKVGIFYAYLANSIGTGPIWNRGEGTIIGLSSAYDPNAGTGGTLFFGGTNPAGNQIHAVDPATGADRYPPLSVGKVHGNIAIANGLLFVNQGPQGVAIFNDATGEAVTVLVPAQAGTAYSGVTVSQGTVYWLSGPFLNAWRLP